MVGTLRWLAGLWPLAVRRTPAKGTQLALLALGMTVTCTLLAVGPIYARALRSAGIEFAVREEVSDAPGIEVIAGSARPAQPGGGERYAAIAQRARDRLGWLLSEETTAFRGPRLFLEGAGLSSERPPVLELRAIGGYEEHVTVVEGELPRGDDGGALLPLVISREAAAALGLGTGDRLRLAEDFDTCARIIPSLDRPPPPPCTPSASLRFVREAVVAALVEPRDPEDPFWVRGTAVHFALGQPLPDTGPVVPAFVPPERYLRSYREWWPGYLAEASFIGFADPSRVGSETAARAREEIEALRTELDPLGGFVVAPLGEAIARAEKASSVAEGPLLVLLAEVSAIALFFVFTVGAAAAERNAEETALLRARGASIGQVLGLELLTAAWTAVPAFLAGPLLATGAVALLGLTPMVPAGELLEARPTGLSYVLSAGGAAAGAVAAALPTALTARRAARERRGAARPTPPAFQRYYVDIAFAVVAALFVWELEQEGSAFALAGSGAVETDPSALLAPAVAVLAAGALSLRLYPFAARAARWLTGWRPAAAVALWRIEREPAPHARLAVLVLMAATVAAFAASYGPTVDQSRRDRALFASPVPVSGQLPVAAGVGTRWEEAESALSATEGLTAATLVYRATHSLATVGAGGPQVHVLALDPAAASDLLWFRSDFAERSLRELMLAIAGPASLPGIRLPSDAVAISLWVNSTATRESVTLWARVRDRAGRYALLELGKLDTTGWRELRANLTGRLDPLEPPVDVVGLLMTEPPNQFNASDAPLLLDDLGAVRADGSLTVIEGFEGGVPWATLPSPRPNADRFEVGNTDDREGRVGVFRFRVGQTGERRGIFIQDVSIPLPAIATASFTERTGIGKGGRGLLAIGQAVVPFEVREVVSHFPTLPAEDGPALVLDRGRLRAWTDAFDLSGRRLAPTEAWVELAPGLGEAERGEVLRRLAQPPLSLQRLTVQAEAVARAERNPLLAASGKGAFALALGGAGLVAAAGLTASAGAAVARRRTEFAVLRVLGCTQLQVTAMLGVEYALVLAFGLAAGFGIGSALSRHLLRFLNVNEGGEPVEPPARFVFDWSAAGLAAATLALAAGIALAWAWWRLRRVDDAATLRMGYNIEG
jgi:hypothetical protein